MNTLEESKKEQYIKHRINEISPKKQIKFIFEELESADDMNKIRSNAVVKVTKQENIEMYEVYTSSNIMPGIYNPFVRKVLYKIKGDRYNDL